MDLRKRLETGSLSLEFPPGFDSPRGFDPTAMPVAAETKSTGAL